MTDILAIILGFLGLLSPTPAPVPTGPTYAYISVENPENIFLYPNFSQKQTSVEFKNSHDCKAITSAGFYTKDNKPVGLFVGEGGKIRDFIPNTLFNGVFSTDRFSLQTGPVLIKDGNPQTLRIRDDEPTRRIVAATGTNNTLLYIAFYNADSVYEGPLLGDLPQKLVEFQNKTGIKISDAYNLDGGDASAFITSDINLGELTPVGSFFCVK